MPGVHGSRRILLTGAFLGLLAAVPLAAQETPAAPAPASYEVEILVFRHLDPSGTTPEAPPPAAMTAAVSSAPEADAAPAPEPAYPALLPAAMQLAAAANQMRRSGRYRPIVHTGWTQPAAGQASAIAVPLPAEATASGLRGAVTLFRERFLHVVVDLQLDEAAGGLAGPARLHQSRRIRGRAWQHFDHPRFGAIVAVRAIGAGALPPAAATPDSSPGD